MFLYKDTVAGFKRDVDSNQIVSILDSWFENCFGRRVGSSERRSWGNSLGYMERVVRRSGIDDSCGVLIEYVIPSTSNRIDFFVSGHDDEGNRNFVIVELKQWERAEATEKEDIVSTFVGGGVRDVSHPSYQAQSYKLFLRDYNEAVAEDELMAHSCAYLHNFEARNPEPLATGIYTQLVEDTPIYFRDDQEKLENFLQRFVGRGRGDGILYEIESGKIRPSKKLIDHVSSMFEGNQEFVLLDEQKVAYETAKYVARTAKTKSAVIVKGGPGTGKSVVSVNLLGGLLKSGLNVVFVAPNASFRDVMIDRLAKHHPRTRLKNLFKGSSAFVDVSPNTFDVIIVDEAHRLKNRQAYMYQGENQVEDIMNAARTSIFFIDDDQAIRPEDVGSVSEIKRVAHTFGVDVQELELTAQFRCSGAEGYINWLNDVLHIKQTANFDGWDKGNFDFKIFDDPNKLREAIKQKHDQGHKARILAGYAWKWTAATVGNSDGQVGDVEIAEYDFKMPWNSRRVGTTWAIDPSGIDQVGCIHTSQGLEFDYIGVIVGPDLRFDPKTTKYFTNWEEYKDTSGKKGLKDDPERMNRFVRNIYKILMTRGMRGCYIFVADKEVLNYLNVRMSNRL